MGYELWIVGYGILVMDVLISTCYNIINKFSVFLLLAMIDLLIVDYGYKIWNIFMTFDHD